VQLGLIRAELLGIKVIWEELDKSAWRKEGELWLEAAEEFSGQLYGAFVGR